MRTETPPSRSTPPTFDLEPLEGRQLLSTIAIAPATPRADTLGPMFDHTERQAIIRRMTNLPASTRQTLQGTTFNPVEFDRTLRNHMTGRSTGRFYFIPDATPTNVQFLKDNLGLGPMEYRAERVTRHHVFPASGNDITFSVKLPPTINWRNPVPVDGDRVDPDFPHTLNRHSWWQDLAIIGRSTGEPRFLNELRYELASWHQQFPTPMVPTEWTNVDKQGWPFTNVLQASSWTWAYFTALGDPVWTAADNSLMLYKLLQLGDALQQQADGGTSRLDSNRTLALGKSLHLLGNALPEFDSAATWERTGRDLMFATMDAQVYADGSHVEQSPGYATGILGDLLEAYRLDVINRHAWPAERVTRVENAVEAQYQLLMPDGRQSAIGDTYRGRGQNFFMKAELALGKTPGRWGGAVPDTRDVFMFGTDAVRPYVRTHYLNDWLPNRGTHFALPDGGTYVLRDAASGRRQITFDAGPKGNGHGHYDLFSFELTGVGGSYASQPLIIDPGPYKYDRSPERAHVISTAAHNTISIGGQNHAAVEGSGNPSIRVHRWDVTPTHATVSATHWAYAHLPGSPVVTRTLWFDLNRTLLIVDRVESTRTQTIQQSFTLPSHQVGTYDYYYNSTGPNTPSTIAAGGAFRTRQPVGDNVRVTPLNLTAPAAEVERRKTFVTHDVSNGLRSDAYRYTVTKTEPSTVFVTAINLYPGGATEVPATVATSRLLTPNPRPRDTVRVRVTYPDGTNRDVEFAPPPLERLANDATPAGGVNDVAFGPDGRLHLVYQDRVASDLKYAVRDTSGNWSASQTIDAGQFLGEYVSLKLDNAGRPGVAYFDGWAGDLKYAHLSHVSNAWEVSLVDAKGSVGLYPSLNFSRNGTGAAVISYYDRSRGALKMATFQGDRWDVAILAGGDTRRGDVGRFSQLLLDPNRLTSTKWAIGYEDTRQGKYLYTIQWKDTWRTETIDPTMRAAGGYLSLAFYDSGRTQGDRHLPAASFYDVSQGTALRYSRFDGTAWQPETIDARPRRGLYSQLIQDGTTPSVFYFDRTNNLALRADRKARGGWDFSLLGDGGRELHVARHNGTTVYTNLDERAGRLSVKTM